MQEKSSEVKYIDPINRGHNDYYDHLTAFNSSVQKRLVSELEELFEGFDDNFCISVTGSDARLEKSTISLIEAVLLTPGTPNPDLVKELDEYVEESYGSSEFDACYLEKKDLSRDKSFEFVLNRGTPNQIILVSPNRVLDNRILYGNQDLDKKLRHLLAAELISKEDGSSVFERVKDKVKEHRKVTIAGVQRYKGQDLVHYNPEEGVAYYDPEASIWSFKQGPLRAVQYALVRDIVKAIRAGADPDSFLFLPQNTVAKLNTVEVEGKTDLSTAQIKDLTDCYKYFLWLYHKSQTEYCGTNHSQQTRFDPKEVKERCRTIDSICQQQIIK